LSDYDNIKMARTDSFFGKKIVFGKKIKHYLWYYILYGTEAIKILNVIFFSSFYAWNSEYRGTVWRTKQSINKFKIKPEKY